MKELIEFKGPILDEFQKIKEENKSAVREIDRVKNDYRELIKDYLKTFD